MRAVKRALDPEWKLAPGVLFPSGSPKGLRYELPRAQEVHARRQIRSLRERSPYSGCLRAPGPPHPRAPGRARSARAQRRRPDPNRRRVRPARLADSATCDCAMNDAANAASSSSHPTPSATRAPGGPPSSRADKNSVPIQLATATPASSRSRPISRSPAWRCSSSAQRALGALRARPRAVRARARAAACRDRTLPSARRRRRRRAALRARRARAAAGLELLRLVRRLLARFRILRPRAKLATPSAASMS